MSAPETPEQQAREPVFTLPQAVMGLALMLLLIEVGSQLVLDAEGQNQLALWFGYIPQRITYPDLIPGGQLPLLWTALTHAFLHAGWEHALINIAWLAIFGTPVARRYGTIGFAIIFAAGSIAGALAFSGNAFGNLAILVGASGGISGLTGAAVRFMFQPVLVGKDPETGERVVLGRRLASFRELMVDPRSRFFTLIWIVLNGLAPFVPYILGGAAVQIAWEAHLGGFFSGLFLVGVLEGRGNWPARLENQD